MNENMRKHKQRNINRKKKNRENREKNKEI